MREPDLLWEAALTACYGDTQPVLTASERRKIGKLLKELREINATPEDLIARARQYPKVMPKGTILTLAALINHWSRCKPPEQKHYSTPKASYIPPQGRATPEGIKTAYELLPSNVQRMLKAKHRGDR